MFGAAGLAGQARGPSDLNYFIDLQRYRNDFQVYIYPSVRFIIIPRKTYGFG